MSHLRERASDIGRAWSKSWVGDQANLYYKDFKPPPPDEEFDQLSGKLLRDQPAWIKYSDEEVRSRIHDSIDADKVERATEIANRCTITFEDKKDDVISILELVDSQENSYINGIRMAINDLKIPTANQIVKELAPNSIITRDIIALSKRSRTPPHLRLFAETVCVRHGIKCLQLLQQNISRAINHLKRVTSGGIDDVRNGNNIFIGHGGSTEWEKLRDFIENRLKREIAEFDNNLPTSKQILDHILELVQTSAVAFVLLTAEDRLENGNHHPRLNVVHELGLCQAILGVDNTIILLEDDCEEFSNIRGLVQIRFPRGNLMAKSEEMRRVLEDRGIIPG